MMFLVQTVTVLVVTSRVVLGQNIRRPQLDLQLDSSQQRASQQQHPCADDLSSICGMGLPDSYEGVYNARLCLRHNHEDVSVGCQIFVEKTSPSIVEPCFDQISTFCKDMKPGSGRIHSCLYDSINDLTVRCANALIDENTPKELEEDDFQNFLSIDAYPVILLATHSNGMNVINQFLELFTSIQIFQTTPCYLPKFGFANSADDDNDDDADLSKQSPSIVRTSSGLSDRIAYIYPSSYYYAYDWDDDFYSSYYADDATVSYYDTFYTDSEIESPSNEAVAMAASPEPNQDVITVEQGSAASLFDVMLDFLSRMSVGDGSSPTSKLPPTDVVVAEGSIESDNAVEDPPCDHLSKTDKRTSIALTPVNVVNSASPRGGNIVDQLDEEIGKSYDSEIAGVGASKYLDSGLETVAPASPLKQQPEGPTKKPFLPEEGREQDSRRPFMEGMSSAISSSMDKMSKLISAMKRSTAVPN